MMELTYIAGILYVRVGYQELCGSSAFGRLARRPDWTVIQPGSTRRGEGPAAAFLKQFETF